MILAFDGAFPYPVGGRASRRENMRAVLGGLLIVGVLMAATSAGVLASANEGNQPVAWFREFGTPGLDAARAIAVDDGKVYAAGLVSGTLPGQDAAGGSDVFLQRYNNDGKEMWTRQFGTAGDDAATVVGSLDVEDRNIYVGGLVSAALPGQSYAGDWDAFVRRYDPAGHEVWTRQFGTEGPDVVQGISVNHGSVYIGGFTSGALPGQTHAGGVDGFVRMYDEQGGELWTRQFGTSGVDMVWSLAAGGTGVYVVGQTDGALPGQSSAGGVDAFIRKYDKAGNEVWTRQFGTSGSDALHGVAIHDEVVYAAGEVQGTLPDQTSSGGFDAFVQKYDPTGGTTWTRQFGTTGRDNIWGVEADETGVFVVGFVGGALPGQTYAGVVDAFVRWYGDDGSLRFTFQFGTPGPDIANDVAFEEPEKGVYVAGATSGPLLGQPYSGDRDAFVLKIVPEDGQNRDG
jgi:hypothetical protein